MDKTGSTRIQATTIDNLPPEDRRELRAYAWQYFDRHADQRLKTLKFYLIIATAITAAVIAVTKDGGWTLAALPLTGGLFAISLIFWGIETRNHELLRHSEEALKLLEDAIPLDDESPGVPHRVKLLQRHEADLQRRRRESPGTIRWTYRICFRLIFVLFTFGSAIASVLILMNAKSK